jgi:hypothetical protein
MTWLTWEETIGCLLFLEWAIIASTALEWEEFLYKIFPGGEW